jgi:hypothetical protein
VPSRFARYVGWMGIACVVFPSSIAWCQTPLASYFAEEPADALIRHLEPGLGFSMALADAPADALSARWEVSSGESNGLVAADPITGLTVARQHRRLPELGLLLIETTLTNRGAQPRDVDQIGLADWTLRLRDSQDQGYRKLTYRAAMWYESTFWTGPDWTRVGKNWHHPGENTPSVRRFTAPSDGRVKITGRVFKLHVDGDGVRLSIRHNRETVWQAEIEGKDEQGVEPDVELDVRAGDAIRFVVHKRVQIFCDTTHWDPLVTYADGRKFQASESFSTTRQGLGGWSYEMEADGQGELGLPRLDSFGLDFALRDSALRVGETASLSNRDALPIMLLADGIDQSGIVLALSGSEAWQCRTTLSGDEQTRYNLDDTDNGPRLWTAFAKLSPDIGDHHALQFGLSYAHNTQHQEVASHEIELEEEGGHEEEEGHHEDEHMHALLQNGLDGSADLWGIDVVYKYDSDGAYGKGDFKFQAEYLRSIKDMKVRSADIVDEDTGEFLGVDTSLIGSGRKYTTDGLYAQAVYGFAPKWSAGVRYDVLGLTNEVSGSESADFGSSDRWTLDVTWKLSELALLRAQYSRSDILVAENERERFDAFYLQFLMSLGSHGHAH